MGTLKKTELILKSSIEFPCSYIKGRFEKRIFVNIPKDKTGNEIISKLTQKGFRRNYDHMYIPSCKNCISCVSLRLNIPKFIYSKSNKRNLKTNSDLSLVDNQCYSEKRFELFKQYCKIRHSDGQMRNMSQSDFINFFHRSKNKIKIFDLVNSNQELYGSILLDVLDDGYSAVYSFFDPYSHKRGLGKNLILTTVKKLKEQKKSYLYLGYWIRESKNMNYKSSFNNVEYFVNGEWKDKL